jgi:hypothetical protein
MSAQIGMRKLDNGINSYTRFLRITRCLTLPPLYLPRQLSLETIMKTTRIALVVIALTLTGCATYDTTNAIDPNFGSASYMSRQDVIAATKECEAAGMRAKVVYVDAALNGKRMQVPHDVFCEPSVRRTTNSPYIKP